MNKLKLKGKQTFTRSSYNLKPLSLFGQIYKIRNGIYFIDDANKEFENYGAYLGNPAQLSKKNKDTIVSSKVPTIMSYLDFCNLKNFKIACTQSCIAHKSNQYLITLKQCLFDSTNGENTIKIDSLTNFLSNKINEFILNAVLVEASILHDYMNSPSQLDQSIKDTPTITGINAEKHSNMSSVFLDYLNKRQMYLYEEYFYNATDAHTPIKRMRQLRYNIEKEYRPNNSYYESFPNVDNYYTVTRDKTAESILKEFKLLYNKPFSENEYIKNDIAFIFMMNADYMKWLPETTGLYISYLLRYIHNDNFLYKKFEKFKQKRIANKNNDPGSEFNSIAEVYERMISEIKSVLFAVSEIENNRLKYTCNKFLFSNLLHPNFCSSLDSDLFNEIYKYCDLDLLINYEESSAPSDEQSTSAIFYDLLLLLAKYDINLKELQKVLAQKDENSSNSFDFGKLQLVYNFLSIVDINIGQYINEALQLLHDSNYSHHDYCIKNTNLLNSFASQITNKLPSKEADIFPKGKYLVSYNNNQRKLINQILLHLGCKGWLYTVNYP